MAVAPSLKEIEDWNGKEDEDELGRDARLIENEHYRAASTKFITGWKVCHLDDLGKDEEACEASLHDVMGNYGDTEHPEVQNLG